MVGVDPAEGHQVEFFVEHLPVQFITWQAFPATVVEDIQHRCGVLHYAYLQVGVSGHLCPFALWTVFPSSLEGRCSFDYYGHSVAIELAFLRRSHVRSCYTF